MQTHAYCTLPDIVTAHINAYSRTVAIFLKILYFITNNIQVADSSSHLFSFDLFFEKNSGCQGDHPTNVLNVLCLFSVHFQLQGS